MNDFIIINSEADLPKEKYSENRRLFLCITKAGKTVVCKFVGEPYKLWENAAYWRDALGDVVAYKEITIPDEVLDLCTGKHVEYFDGLKE